MMFELYSNYLKAVQEQDFLKTREDVLLRHMEGAIIAPIIIAFGILIFISLIPISKKTRTLISGL